MTEIQTPEEGTEPTDQVTPQADPEPETPQTPPVEENPVENQEGNEQNPPQPEPQQPDYKDKFRDSAREGILQNERLKQKDAQIAQLTTKDTPNDEEMRALYPEWDRLDDYNKRVLTNQELANRRATRAEQVATTLIQKQEFDDKLDDFVESPPDEFKGLKGKESDFKRFAKRKNNVGLPLDVLAKAYLFDVQDDMPTPHTPTLTPGLEKGSGGPRTAPKPKKITLEEAAEIRKRDWKEYKRLVDAGMIEELE